MSEVVVGALGVHRYVQRRVSQANPTYRISENDRDVMAVMYWLNLWSDTAIARAFGVDRAVVRRTAQARWLE